MKKYIILISVLTVFSVAVSIESNEVLQKDIHQELWIKYYPEKISNHTYVIHGPDAANIKEQKGFINNPAFIIGDTSVVVIDPGSSVQIGRAVLAHIRKITDKVISHVFVTHIHGDHWLGNQAFLEDNPKVKFFASEAMIKEAKSGADNEWLQIMDNLTNHATIGTKAIIPDHFIKDQEIIKVGDLSIRPHVVEWAHTKTDVMLEFIEDKVLFTGDIVNNYRIVNFNEGSFRGSVAAISNSMTLLVDKVVPGHGASGGKEILERYLKLLNIIYRTTQELSEKGFETYEMKPEVIKKLSAYKNWFGIDNELGRYIIIAALEVEQAEFD